MITNANSQSGRVTIGHLSGMGGNKFSGQHMSKYFNYGSPFHFGLKVARIWASQSRFYPKYLTAQTLVAGNYHLIDNSVYDWFVMGDVDRVFRIMEDAYTTNGVASTAALGANNTPFEIVLDTDYARTNNILGLQDNRYTLVVMSDPKPYGNWFKYTVRQQTSNPNDFVPAGMVARDTEVTEFGSSIEDFGTPAKPGINFGTQIQMRNVVGKVGREFTIDEVVMRREWQAKKYGNTQGASSNMSANLTPSDFVNGIAFQLSLTRKDSKSGAVERVQKNAFISLLEAKAEEMCMLDREVMAKFGKYEETFTSNGTAGTVTSTTNVRRVAPGMRQLVKDGHEKYHNGNLTAFDIEGYLHGIFLTRVDENDRKIQFVTGELGKLFFNQILSIEAQGYLSYGQNLFIRQVDGGPSNHLEFGFQFIKYQGVNGIEVSLTYDRMLDDTYYCRRMYSKNSNFTIDSARMEVYDFGASGAAKNMSGTNICMVAEDLVDERRWRMSAANPYMGYVSVSPSDTKDATFHITMSGSVNVWDTSRIGAIVYEPEYV